MKRLALLTAALAFTLIPTLHAQPPAAPASIQSALASDAGKLGDKFSALAGAMAGKYDWRPGTGVRSVGEVFNLILAENNMLVATLSGTPAGPRPEPITDSAKLQEALKASYAALAKAVSGLPDSDLNTPVKLFGRDFTKQSAAMLLLGDQHEHLGQSIAYARMNSVVPPWSK